jgi:SAM-dependent methyltransferase
MDTFATEALNDEIFCLKYELNLLAGQLLEYKLERWIEGFTSPEVQIEHMQRYDFASRFTEGRKVLDIACGTGRGSRLLAEKGAASEVIGLDIDASTVRYAQTRNRHARVSFRAADILELGNSPCFDVVVCFETIEHVSNPELFLGRLAALLKSEGVLLISTPVSTSEFDAKPQNQYHLQEWGCLAFQRLVSSKFQIRRIHLQYRSIPGFWTRARILAKFRGQPVRMPATPQWREFDAASFSLDAVDSPWAGFQILECSAS